VNRCTCRRPRWPQAVGAATGKGSTKIQGRRPIQYSILLPFARQAVADSGQILCLLFQYKAAATSLMERCWFDGHGGVDDAAMRISVAIGVSAASSRRLPTMPASFPTRARSRRDDGHARGQVRPERHVQLVAPAAVRRGGEPPPSTPTSVDRSHAPASGASSPSAALGGDEVLRRPPSNRRAGQFPPSMRWPVRSEPHSPCFLFTAAVIL
jgi:hypothetical protein